MLVTCFVCGKKIERDARRVNEARKMGWRCLCSRKCASKLYTTRVNKICVYCGKAFEVPNRRKHIQRFCSQKCSTTWLANTRKKKRPPCVVCGKTLLKGQRYCSLKCSLEHRYRVYIKQWLAGTRSGSTKDPSRKAGYKPSPYVVRWLRETRGNKCEKCGWCKRHPLSGTVPLQPHHIDGNGSNNRPENLKLLCPSCHSLTPNWGSRNRSRAVAQLA